MFTVEQIEKAHEKVKSGTDFPKYIQELKQLGVASFITWVNDSHTEYFGRENYQTSSKPKYTELSITNKVDQDKFTAYLKIHQQGKTDYYTFCTHCAETGIEKWIVDLGDMTCIYYGKSGNKILEENIPNLF